jgi:uncharacterized protein (DUF2342 family)
MNCLTAAAAPQSGAFNFDSDAEKAAMSARLFPPSDWTLSNQYRDAYTMSAGLMGNVKQREAQANAQMKGGSAHRRGRWVRSTPRTPRSVA